MRLVARVERKTFANGTKSLRCVFPDKRRTPFMYENILRRNLGPRPYAEGSYLNENGERVIVYMK